MKIETNHNQGESRAGPRDRMTDTQTLILPTKALSIRSAFLIRKETKN